MKYVGARGHGAAVWGFVDGTLKIICQASKHQRRRYSGYKKRHATNFRAIATPGGLTSHLAGLFEVKFGDWEAWRQSKVEQHLRLVHQAPRNPPRNQRHVYGDLACSPGFGVIEPYKKPSNRPLSLETQAFNTYMSSPRISVIHSFVKISALANRIETNRIQNVILNIRAYEIRTEMSPSLGFIGCGSNIWESNIKTISMCSFINCSIPFTQSCLTVDKTTD